MEVFFRDSLRVDYFDFDFKFCGIDTYDSSGNQLSYCGSSGWWWKSTYDSAGNETSRVRGDGFWVKKTYDSFGNQLSYSNSWVG